MSLRCKYATATLAVAACVFVASGARAVESNAVQLEAAGSTAFSDPVSAPCHPALGACAKHSQRVAAATKGGPTVLAYEEDARTERDPVSAPCHPALKACANWARAAQTSGSTK